MSVGSIYYFKLGIQALGICNYRIEVLQGSTKLPELTTFSLDNTTPPCLGDRVTHTVQDPVPGTSYVFTLNGDTISTTDQVTIDYRQPGTYELCISGYNSCYQSTPQCYTFDIPPARVTDTLIYLCPGECSETPGSSLCEPGTYRLTLQGRNGCDSLVDLTIVTATSDTTYIAATICSGDTLRYLRQDYFRPGDYPRVLTNRYGCDSVVELSLTVTACPLQGHIYGVDIACADDSHGSFSFALTSGSPPYRYDFRRLGGGIQGSGTVAARSDTTTIDGLPPGTYLIEVTDDFGSVGYLNTEIERPKPISLSASVTSYNGSDLSCAGASDGAISVTASGGSGTLTYRWPPDTGSQTDGAATGLPAGSYTIEVTDANQCAATITAVIDEPTSLTLSATVTAEQCDAPATGRLLEPSASGGTGLLQLQLRLGSTVIDPVDYTSLTAGNYRMTATDANGCTKDTLLNIAAPERPTLATVASPQIIELGEPVSLIADSSPNLTYRWEPANLVACADCPRTTARPLTATTFTLTATSRDSCSATDTVLVHVLADHRVYVPSAFSPNNDGRNDVLYLYPGRAVRQLKRLAVYDRWGGLSYQSENVAATALNTVGWDGWTAGRPALPGVYVWSAEVEFIDGATEIFRGSTLLIP